MSSILDEVLFHAYVAVQIKSIKTHLLRDTSLGPSTSVQTIDALPSPPLVKFCLLDFPVKRTTVLSTEVEPTLVKGDIGLLNSISASFFVLRKICYEFEEGDKFS